MYTFWAVGARQYLKYNPTERQIREPRVLISNTESEQKRRDFIEEEMPLAFLDLISKLPLVGSQK